MTDTPLEHIIFRLSGILVHLRLLLPAQVLRVLMVEGSRTIDTKKKAHLILLIYVF